MTASRLQDILRAAVEHCIAAGVPDPQLDAEWLLAHVLGRPRHRLALEPNLLLNETQRQQFSALLHRRLSREPLQYLLGTQEFFGRTFRVTPAVLIPRPETEHLIECALPHLAPTAASSILDLGTGSGCLAITLALERPLATITATDISVEAIDVARDNAVAHGVADRIDFTVADLWPAMRRRFDLIVSNPPYCVAADWPTLQPEVRDHEPRGAIVGGDDGLAFYRRIIQDAPAWLTTHGVLTIECGADQAEPIRALLAARGAFTEITITRDLAGHERIITARSID